jgi:hypothetical protein
MPDILSKTPTIASRAELCWGISRRDSDTLDTSYVSYQPHPDWFLGGVVGCVRGWK